MLNYSQNHPLDPPFSEAKTFKLSTTATLTHRVWGNDQCCDREKDRSAYLSADLHTPRLGKVHRYLWLAGLPRFARPLHRQQLLLRTIYVTESPDEHLVWHEKSIFIKPLPTYLLHYDFWRNELCNDDALHKSACGLLLSYAWLVCSKSDLRLAVEIGLLPSEIDWDSWTSFMVEFLDRVDARRLCQVDSRYHYGELRLTRLNSLYRYGAAGFSLHNATHGFMSASTRYTTFFERNFSWLLVVFIYLTVVLSAMQVASATNRFGDDIHFQKFSYGVALFSIAFVLGAAAIMLLVWSTLFWYHLLSTMQYCKMAEKKREGRE